MKHIFKLTQWTHRIEKQIAAPPIDNKVAENPRTTYSYLGVRIII